MKATDTRTVGAGAEAGLRLRRVAAGVYALTAVVLAVSIAAAPASQPDRYFTEKQTVHVFSAALLYTGCLLSLFNYAAAKHGLAGSGALEGLTRFWLLATVGLAWLALDELFALHEGIDDGLFRALGLKEGTKPLNYDAAIIAGYGVAGLAILARYRRELVEVDGFFAYLIAGGFFAAVSVVCDLFDEGVPQVYFEDGSKLFANASFAIACVAAAGKTFGAIRARATYTPDRR